MKCEFCGGLSEWRNLFGLGGPYVECTCCGATAPHPPPDDDDRDDDEDEDLETADTVPPENDPNA